MRSHRATASELRASGCTAEEIDLLLLVEKISRRRERARRAHRFARSVGAALARWFAWPAALRALR